jgi:thiol-disulfide isomerase/thioredoxin
MKQGIVVTAASLGLLICLAWSKPAAASEWIGKQAPELANGDWINSSPLSIKELRGKVVLLEFWTFGCYNCLNTLPHVKEWYRKYAGTGFEIIGIHTPEFEREKDLATVRRKVTRLGISYPVVTDNEYQTWSRYNQQYWPVIYLLDKKGVVRHVRIGEGGYEETERRITSLLAEQ